MRKINEMEVLNMSDKKDEVQTDPTVLNPGTKFGGGGPVDKENKPD